jgi:hypothetical protein
MRILDVDPVPPAEAPRLTGHLAEGERVDAAFVSPTGTLLFTELRLLLVLREHLLEEKVETGSWPYREVRRFSIQDSEDGRAALRIWLGDEPQPLHLRARPEIDLRPLQRLLAERLR